MYSLVVDIGTQRMKVMVFDEHGNIVSKRSHEYDPPYHSPKPGWAEYSAEEYWNLFMKMAKEVLEGVKERVKAVAVTSQRDSLVFVDENANSLRPIILWLDHRLADFDLKLSFFEEILYKAAGKWRTIRNVYRQATVNWIRQKEQEIWRKTHKILQISGYFIAKLTGRFVDSVASQVGHIPFDYRRRTWSSKRDIKSKLFPVPKEKLPELVEPGQIVEKLRKEIKEELGIDAFVVAAGSDKSCETLGLGVINENEASLSLSTTSTVQTTTRKYFETLPHLPPYPGMIKGTYNPEVEIFRGFWLVRWFRDEFAHLEKEVAKNSGRKVEELIDKLLDRTSAGSLGLVTQPFWTPGLDNPEAKGAIVGFSSFHKREHLYRSLIEGIFYALRDGMERMEKRGRIKFKAIKVGGGASRSDAVVKIASSIFNLPVYRSIVEEPAGLGAAMAAFTGSGVYDSLEDAAKEMVKMDSVFEPNRKDAEVYDRIYKEFYKKLYSRLKPLYKNLDKVLDEY